MINYVHQQLSMRENDTTIKIFRYIEKSYHHQNLLAMFSSVWMKCLNIRNIWPKIWDELFPKILVCISERSACNKIEIQIEGYLNSIINNSENVNESTKIFFQSVILVKKRLLLVLAAQLNYHFKSLTITYIQAPSPCGIQRAPSPAARKAPLRVN